VFLYFYHCFIYPQQAKLKATMNGPLVFWGKILSKEFQKLIIDRDIIETAHRQQWVDETDPGARLRRQ
jgi:hypothetical protein